MFRNTYRNWVLKLSADWRLLKVSTKFRGEAKILKKTHINVDQKHTPQFQMETLSSYAIRYLNVKVLVGAINK